MLSVCFYYFILIVAVFWAYNAEHSTDKKKEFCYRFLLFFTLWIPAAIRLDIGTDYVAYVDLYNHLQPDDIEFGFYIICRFLNWLGAGSQWMFAIIAFLTYVPVCFGIPKKGMCFSLFFFCCLLYLSTFSLIRQGAAVCLIWYASYTLMDRKKIKYLALMLLAASLHYSAFLVLPFYFAWNKPLNRTVAVILMLVGTIFIQYFNAIDLLFASEVFLDSHYGNYATGSFNRETELGTGLGVVIRLLIPVCFFLLFPSLKKNVLGYGYIAYLNVAYVLAYILAVNIHIFNRIADLFSFVPIFTIGVVAVYARNKYKSIILLIIVVLNIALYYKTITSNDSSKYGGLGIYPYRNILFF